MLTQQEFHGYATFTLLLSIALLCTVYVHLVRAVRVSFGQPICFASQSECRGRQGTHPNVLGELASLLTQEVFYGCESNKAGPFSVLYQ